jgi:hypothetical protein
MAWQKPKSATLHLSIRTQGKARSKATPMTLGLIMIKDAHASEHGHCLGDLLRAMYGMPS